MERVPGFDGEYGTIKLFEQTEIENLDGQLSLFDNTGSIQNTNKISGNTGTVQRNRQPDDVQENPLPPLPAPQALNPRQQQAVQSIDRAVAVIAGPGTGKTKTLISRILYLLETRKVKPSEITAVTFTNKAAAEMQERLKQQLGKGRSARLIQVGTFHSICLIC